jgi:uncharacterized caspase-like protein/Tfp pilus assembly protein PilF
MVRVAVVLLMFVMLPSSSEAAKRVALVIGNSAYTHAGTLANPRNDATDVAAALKKSGFEVIQALDLDKAAFDRKIRDFATALSGAEAGVFFYAGHGLQVGGKNYLVPTDAKVEDAAGLDFEMVQLDLVHRTMERQTSTNVIFLDACRNNPLARNLARAMGTRSAEIGRGLAPVESGVGTLISFSTQPGNVASDGAGRNSPFAGALVKQLSSSTDDLSALLIDVRNDVRKVTENKQVPWEHSALTGRFYFNAAPQTTAPPAVVPWRLSEAAEAWGVTKDTTSIAELEAFIARFKDTYYATLARVRIEELKKREIAVASPATTTAAPSLAAVIADCSQTLDADRQLRGCNEAIRRNPTYAAGYHTRGNVYLTQKQFDLAISDYSKAIDIDPKMTLAYHNRAFSYSSKEQYDLAISDYSRAIAIDPNYVLAYLGRGFAYTNSKQYDLAIRDYGKVIATDPKPSRAYNGRGQAYFGKKQYDLAIGDFSRAIAIDPGVSDLYLNRGRTYIQLHNNKEALADYQKALSIDPSSQLARDGLRYLEKSR